MQTASDFETFLSKLDEESAQDTRVEAHEGSIFEGAPDSSTMLTRAREFDDIAKHWVRRELWLKTIRRIKKAKGAGSSAGVRLLTLPGRNLFEVKLYAKEQLLEQMMIDGNMRFGVVGFETDPTILGLQRTMEPRLLELLRGDILAALVDHESANGRIVRQHAPYDVINLDLTGNIATTNDGPYSPFLKGVRECFQLQGTQTHDWALMVTFRAGMLETERTVVDLLVKFLQDNMKTHLSVKEGFLQRYGIDSAKKLLAQRPEEGLGQVTGKWVIEQGHAFEWSCTHYRHAAYDRQFERNGRQERYSLRKLVFEFSRRTTGKRQLVLGRVPVQSWHADDLSRLFLEEALVNVDSAMVNIRKEYRSFLEAEIDDLRGAGAGALGADG